MKNVKIIFISALCAVILIGCQNQKVKKSNPPTYKSAKLKLVDRNIDAMGAEPWDKNIYVEIRDDQIPLLKGSEQVAANEYLEYVYQNVMVRDADSILTEACAHNHSLLADLVKEMKPYEKDNKECARVIQRKKTHDDILSFAKNAVGRQPVKTFKDNYDESYETKTREKANEYLASVTCEDLIKRLKSIDFALRRRRYCEDIVALYVAKDEWNIGDQNILIGRMEVYSGNKTDLDRKISQFRIEKITPKVASHIERLQSMDCCAKTLQEAASYFRTLPDDAKKINNFAGYLEAYRRLFELNASSGKNELDNILKNYSSYLSNEQKELFRVMNENSANFERYRFLLDKLHDGANFRSIRQDIYYNM